LSDYAVQAATTANILAGTSIITLGANNGTPDVIAPNAVLHGAGGTTGGNGGIFGLDISSSTLDALTGANGPVGIDVHNIGSALDVLGAQTVGLISLTSTLGMTISGPVSAGTTVTIASDSLAINNTVVAGGGGSTVTLRPFTNGTAINVGGADGRELWVSRMRNSMPCLAARCKSATATAVPSP
jgi:hypothetical protein